MTLGDKWDARLSVSYFNFLTLDPSKVRNYDIFEPIFNCPLVKAATVSSVEAPGMVGPFNPSGLDILRLVDCINR